ncbi:hypothetical protein EB822_10970, partial [Flavobacteriaceae bacterium PRS1]
MFVVGGEKDMLLEYTLSTGYDLTTLTYAGNKERYNLHISNATGDPQPRGIAFNNDGTEMFILGNAADEVNEYHLATAFDISTASHDSRIDITATVGTGPNDLKFSADGTKMFITNNTTTKIFVFTLTIGFDVITASLTSTEDFSAYVNAKFRGLVFNPDGTKMLVISKGSNKKVNEFRLSTGFDLTTASYVANYDITSYETDPHGVAFNNDGSTMYILGTTGDDVNEFTLPYAYSLVLPPTITVTAPNGGETLTGGSTTTITWTSVNISANVKIEYSKDGFSSDTNTITTSTTDDGSYIWTIPNDPSSTVTVRISDVADATVNDVS